MSSRIIEHREAGEAFDWESVMKNKGVRSSLDGMLGSAPHVRKCFTMSRCPSRQAAQRGVSLILPPIVLRDDDGWVEQYFLS